MLPPGLQAHASAALCEALQLQAGSPGWYHESRAFLRSFGGSGTGHKREELLGLGLDDAACRSPSRASQHRTFLVRSPHPPAMKVLLNFWLLAALHGGKVGQKRGE